VSVRKTNKDGDIRRRTRTVVTEGTAKLTQQYRLQTAIRSVATKTVRLTVVTTLTLRL